MMFWMKLDDVLDDVLGDGCVFENNLDEVR